MTFGVHVKDVPFLPRSLAERGTTHHRMTQRRQLGLGLRRLYALPPTSRQRQRALVQEPGLVAMEAAPETRPPPLVGRLDQIGEAKNGRARFTRSKNRSAPLSPVGSLGQHPSNFPPFALDPGNLHRLVGRRLVSHPVMTAALARCSTAIRFVLAKSKKGTPSEL